MGGTELTIIFKRDLILKTTQKHQSNTIVSKELWKQLWKHCSAPPKPNYILQRFISVLAKYITHSENCHRHMVFALSTIVIAYGWQHIIVTCESSLDTLFAQLKGDEIDSNRYLPLSLCCLPEWINGEGGNFLIKRVIGNLFDVKINKNF